MVKVTEDSAAWVVRVRADEGVDSVAYDNKGHVIDTTYISFE